MSRGKQGWGDSSWQSSVKYAENRAQLTIAMQGWGLTDEDMEDWCTWFRTYSKRLPGRPTELSARDVNVAENRLSGRGVKSLLETLSACGVSVMVLKLHHNRLKDGAAVAKYLHSCCGSLRELHLSHNEMSSEAAADIILAAAAAKDDMGSPCYPRQAGAHGASPLWLRLEQNYVSPAELSEIVDPAFRLLKRQGTAAICNVSSKACTPHSCAKHRQNPPVVHAKHLSNQRARPPPPPAGPPPPLAAAPPAPPAEASTSSAAVPELQTLMQPAAPAADVLSMLGMVPKAKEEKGGCQIGPGSCPAGVVAQSSAAEEEKERDFSICKVAEVMRWDEELCKWVQDTIEIIDKATMDATDSHGRIKLSQEVGHKMGNDLKNMILRQPAQPDRGSASSSTGAKGSRTPGSNEVSAVSRKPVPPPEVSPSRSAAVSTRSSRRGSQPSSSDVKQANGFSLNPQAMEFFPTGSTVAKPHEEASELTTSAPSILNPKAAAFRPITGRLLAPEPERLPHGMRGISESLMRMSRTAVASTAVSTGAAGESKEEDSAAAKKDRADSAAAWLEAAAKEVEVPAPPTPCEAEAEAATKHQDVESKASEDREPEESSPSQPPDNSLGNVLRRALAVTSAVIAFGAGTAAVARSRRRNQT